MVLLKSKYLSDIGDQP